MAEHFPTPQVADGAEDDEEHAHAADGFQVRGGLGHHAVGHEDDAEDEHEKSTIAHAAQGKAAAVGGRGVVAVGIRPARRIGHGRIAMRAIVAAGDYGALARGAFARSRHGRSISPGEPAANPGNRVRNDFNWSKLLIEIWK